MQIKLKQRDIISQLIETISLQSTRRWRVVWKHLPSQTLRRMAGWPRLKLKLWQPQVPAIPPLQFPMLRSMETCWPLCGQEQNFVNKLLVGKCLPTGSVNCMTFKQKSIRQPLKWKIQVYVQVTLKKKTTKNSKLQNIYKAFLCYKLKRV